MDWSRNWPAYLVGVAGIVVIAPVWAVEWPALPDLPAHLACFYLLAGGIHDPHLTQYYRIDWQFVPNLASEILVPLFSHVFGLLGSAKAFLTAALVFWVAGAALVERALTRRIGIGSLLAAFFAYNLNFFWGFMNYDFAAGLTLVLFAGWIESAGFERWSRVALFAVAVTILYFCHLFAAALLLLVIGCFELDVLLRDGALFSRRTIDRGIDMLLLVLPSAAAFVFLKPEAADGGHLEFNLLSGFLFRIESATQKSFNSPNFAVIALLLILWLAGTWRGFIRVDKRMRLVLWSLLALAILAPEWALGGWAVHLRIPPVLGAVAFASAEFDLPEVWKRAIAGIAMAALAFTAAAVGGNWAYYDRQYAEFRSVLAQSRDGVKLMAVLDGDAMGLADDEPYWHIAEFAILDRHGFSPLLFTTAGQHVVRLQPEFQPFVASSAKQGSPPDVDNLSDLVAGIEDDEDVRNTFPYLLRFQCHYDEVVVINSGGKPSPVPDLLRLRHRGSFFDLYDVWRDGACARR